MTLCFCSTARTALHCRQMSGTSRGKASCESCEEGGHRRSSSSRGFFSRWRQGRQSQSWKFHFLSATDKTALTHLLASRRLLKSPRELGHEGLVVIYHKYDRKGQLVVADGKWLDIDEVKGFFPEGTKGM